MPEPSFLLMIVCRVTPENAWEGIRVVHARASQPEQPDIQGLHQSLLIESEEEPGRLTWLSTWDTKADSQAFLNSSRYTDMIKTLQPYLLRQPEWYWYSVLEDWAEDVVKAA
jgi:quinol monooxygenase YgiN